MTARVDVPVKTILLAGIGVIGCPLLPGEGLWPPALPLQNLGAVLVALACALAWSTSRSQKAVCHLQGEGFLLIALVAYVVVVGALHHSRDNFRPQFFFREGTWLVLCLAGVALACSNNIDENVRLLRVMNIGASLQLLGWTALSRLDVVGSIHEASGRRVSRSLFALSAIVIVTAPVLAHARCAKGDRMLPVQLLGAVAVLGFTLVSGTRSLALQASASFLLVFYFLARDRRVSLRSAAWLGGIILCSLFVLWRLGEMSLLLERFADRADVTSNDRIVEIGQFRQSVGEWFPEGGGIGLGFESIIGDTGDDYGGLVNAPHLGVAAWTVKAGVFGVIFTLLLVCRAMQSFRNGAGVGRFALDGFSGVAICLVIGMSSGGWTLTDLFLTGLLVAVGRRAA